MQPTDVNQRCESRIWLLPCRLSEGTLHPYLVLAEQLGCSLPSPPPNLPVTRNATSSMPVSALRCISDKAS